ncbi:hypothetical protein ABIC85_002969 [Oerskovia enterophila]
MKDRRILFSVPFDGIVVARRRLLCRVFEGGASIC